MQSNIHRRERNTTVGKVAGTGLGMAIVKKYVDLMGGSIDVKSELGKGTVLNALFTRIAIDYYICTKNSGLRIQGEEYETVNNTRESTKGAAYRFYDHGGNWRTDRWIL